MLSLFFACCPNLADHAICPINKTISRKLYLYKEWELSVLGVHQVCVRCTSGVCLSVCIVAVVVVIIVVVVVVTV